MFQRFQIVSFSNVSNCFIFHVFKLLHFQMFQIASFSNVSNGSNVSKSFKCIQMYPNVKCIQMYSNGSKCFKCVKLYHFQMFPMAQLFRSSSFKSQLLSFRFHVSNFILRISKCKFQSSNSKFQVPSSHMITF